MEVEQQEAEKWGECELDCLVTICRSPDILAFLEEMLVERLSARQGPPSLVLKDKIWRYHFLSDVYKKVFVRHSKLYVRSIGDFGNPSSNLLCQQDMLKEGGENMKRFMIPRIAHCDEGCTILSWV